MTNKYLFLLFLVLIYSCDGKDKAVTSTYFAGEIVNPTSRQVILYKGEEAVDTAELDTDNRFEIQLDSTKEGLYHFFHRPEMQYVYLSPGDSLQIRLNTVAFDESLVFSGEGEDINNFLINLFLNAEKEENLIRESLIRLEPDVFSFKLDSLKGLKMEELDALRAESTISENAYRMARSSIQYKSWFYRESYPFWHKRVIGEETLHKLPEDFYAYRDEVNYNDAQLTFLRPYYDFMIYHIGNLAYMSCRNNCEEEITNIKNQLHFNRHQLKLIDSLVPQEELRDNLFRTVAFEYLLKHDSEENFEVFMQDFHQRSGNNRHLEEITQLSDGIRRLRPNHPLPELSVYNAEDQQFSLREIPNDDREVVFYFWSGPEPRHLRNISNRVRELQDKHEDYRFVGICLRTDRDRWKSLVATYGLDPENQYWAEDFETFAHTLVVYHPYKSIIAKNGMIVDGFANLNTSFR